MKNLIILIAIITQSMNSVYAQYSIENFRTAVQLAEQLQGAGVTILNPEILCKDSFLGTFSGMGDLGFDEGIVLAQNNTERIFRDYDATYVPRNFEPGNYYSRADSVFMNKVVKDWGVPYPWGLVSYKGCVFHFDFIPNNDNISLNFVFTELFMDIYDYSHSGVTEHIGGITGGPFMKGGVYDYRKAPRCDIIGILLSGNEYVDTVNLAVYADEPTVPINTYSLMVDSIYPHSPFPPSGTEYIFDTLWWVGTNRATNLIGNRGGSYMPYFNYPMLTRVFRASAAVQPCETYHLALGIASTRAQPGSGKAVLIDYGGSAIFIEKLLSEGRNIEGCEDTTSSVLPSREAASFCTVYPNPFSSTLQLQISDGQSRSGIYRVRINDILGRPYYEQEGSISAINRSLLTIGDGLVNGVYVLSVEDVKTQQTDYIKIVRE